MPTVVTCHCGDAMMLVRNVDGAMFAVCPKRYASGVSQTPEHERLKVEGLTPVERV